MEPIRSVVVVVVVVVFCWLVLEVGGIEVHIWV